MSMFSMFNQIKTEPLQFYPQNFANPQHPGTVILQANSTAVTGTKNNLTSDVRIIFNREMIDLIFIFIVT